MSALAVIPARGGSKRIPRKNIKDFCGKPIINYSIEAALNAMIFDEVMVSTDDEEIAVIAEACGASVPFMRSKENSDDFSSTVDVLSEVLGCYKKIGYEFTHVCCLYPCAPFITSVLLSDAIAFFDASDAKVVMPVVKYSYPVQRSFKIKNNRIEMLFPEKYSSRSQDLEQVYHDSGQFYYMESSIIYNNQPLFSSYTLPFVVSEMSVHDIDTLEDWEVASMKFELLK